jgi:hypothetical protein
MDKDRFVTFQGTEAGINTLLKDGWRPDNIGWDSILIHPDGKFYVKTENIKSTENGYTKIWPTEGEYNGKRQTD